MSSVRKQTSSDVMRALKKVGNKEKALSNAWFFKTKEGQYGYGDKFIGVTVPEQRRIAKAFKDLDLSEIKKLLENHFHECRLTALIILVGQFKKADLATQNAIAKFYLDNRTHINNWDLVDTSARDILGQNLLTKNRKILYTLARSKILWDRRIAIISTHAFIAHNDFEDTVAISELLLDDKEDLMHKAVGWTLREMGKRSKPALLTFLNSHADVMPRTALRYSIEHFSQKERAHYMAMRNSK
ncbi:MAG TPA: DNA alkylation repair protein [Acidimicrobiia bacterium]|nr:DNA alkylation repair protein [Acidimicrobiia bacterium]